MLDLIVYMVDGDYDHFLYHPVPDLEENSLSRPGNFEPIHEEDGESIIYSILEKNTKIGLIPVIKNGQFSSIHFQIKTGNKECHAYFTPKKKEDNEEVELGVDAFFAFFDGIMITSLRRDNNLKKMIHYAETVSKNGFKEKYQQICSKPKYSMFKKLSPEMALYLSL